MQGLMFPIAVLLGALALPALAQSPVASPEAAPPTVIAQADARADAARAAPADDRAARSAARRDPGCLRHTGSRLQPRGREGCIAYGRSYDRDELQRTGRVDLADALRSLDPAVR